MGYIDKEDKAIILKLFARKESEIVDYKITWYSTHPRNRWATKVKESWFFIYTDKNEASQIITSLQSAMTLWKELNAL